MQNMYQNLDQYNGEPYPSYPQNNGIQYDWEVPNNMVVATPGGVSGVHHHWTKGFYGIGNTSGDIYAGQGYRYPKDAGPYANLYQVGYGGADMSKQYLPPPDTKWWNNQDLQQNSYPSTEIPAFSLPSSKENFSVMTDSDESGVEFLDEVPSKGGNENIKIQANVQPWLLFILFVFAFVTFDFWAETGRLFINEHIRAGAAITWKSTLAWAVGITVIFTLFLYLVGVPLTTFETL